MKDSIADKIIETKVLRDKYAPAYPLEVGDDGTGLMEPYGPGQGRQVSRDPYHEVAGDTVALGDSENWVPTFRYANDSGNAGDFLGIVYYTRKQLIDEGLLPSPA